MAWKCPPLHLPNWNNLWKWKIDMNETTIKTGSFPKTRCQRCGQPTYLYGIHTCTPPDGAKMPIPIPSANESTYVEPPRYA
jgi:hypothetical protein